MEEEVENAYYNVHQGSSQILPVLSVSYHAPRPKLEMGVGNVFAQQGRRGIVRVLAAVGCPMIVRAIALTLSPKQTGPASPVFALRARQMTATAIAALQAKR